MSVGQTQSCECSREASGQQNKRAGAIVASVSVTHSGAKDLRVYDYMYIHYMYRQVPYAFCPSIRRWVAESIIPPWHARNASLLVPLDGRVVGWKVD